ncbi:MAG: TRAP transporter large permease [Alphaproteobacteria bacterium]|nr:TRAP transporter large permease [Alphaproteobacteria bacterium]MCY4319464.1 TRAP transporter large permease [Alphaproteobacteria bacterium]
MGALGAGLITLLALGAPIGVALGGAAVAFILYDPALSANTAFRAFFSFVNKYTLMAIPFFIYAGFLMERTGLISKLFKFADAIIGWLPGGFAYATLIAAVLFGAISGSSTAMAAAMGVIAYPEMIRRGYPVWMAAGVIACGGGIAILIPPSITLILFGIITEESIVKLFFAGFVPGIMLAISDAIIIVFIAWKLKLPAGEFSMKTLRDSTIEALPAILMPVFVLGGLYGGVFTPTEAGAASCAYALVYGLAARRGAFLRDLLPTTMRAANLTAIVFFLLGCVGVFQFLLANKGWPQDVASWVGAQGLSVMGFLIVLLAVLLVLSMFLTGVAILALTVPIIYPVSLTLGIDPIHLGILFALAVEMGGVIPPVGLNLFAVSGTTGVPVTKVMKGAIPFLCTDGIVLVLVLLFPILALWLPNSIVQSVFN